MLEYVAARIQFPRLIARQPRLLNGRNGNRSTSVLSLEKERIMKKTFFVLTLLVVSIPVILMGQTPYYSGYKVYVWAKQGLTLRDGPSKKAQKIKSLPYGTSLIIGENEHYGKADSVVVIPAYSGKDRPQTPALYLPGYWVRVIAGPDTGFVFGGYLSAMTPFDPDMPVTGVDPGPSISAWLAQTAGVLDKRLLSEADLNYTLVYKNHVVEHYHASEGGALSQYIFPEGMSLQDGFLLLNYFADVHLTRKEIAECESFELTVDGLSFHLYSVGLGGGIAWSVRLSWCNGVLIIEEGGGC